MWLVTPNKMHTTQENINWKVPSASFLLLYFKYDSPTDV